jgi:hypothetical protein
MKAPKRLFNTPSLVPGLFVDTIFDAKIPKSIFLFWRLTDIIFKLLSLYSNIKIKLIRVFCFDKSKKNDRFMDKTIFQYGINYAVLRAIYV